MDKPKVYVIDKKDLIEILRQVIFKEKKKKEKEKNEEK